MPARRFLAPQARAGDGRGYLNNPDREYPLAPDPPDVVERIRTATAMCDEPEAPSRAWVNAEAELAAERNRLRLLKQAEEARGIRHALSIENRMKDAQRRAKLKHIDLSSEFYVMRKMLACGNGTAAVERLARLEARLDGVPLGEAA
jgi:predicted GIY-YIG superfamily endonuclease